MRLSKESLRSWEFGDRPCTRPFTYNLLSDDTLHCFELIQLINHRHRHVLRLVAPPAKVSLVHLTFNPTLHLSSRREWVAKCLGQMNDSNRAEAQAELRQVIADAFTAKTLWTTDWAGVQLQRYRFSSRLVLCTVPSDCRFCSWMQSDPKASSYAQA